jgi:hypothetical protein
MRECRPRLNPSVLPVFYQGCGDGLEPNDGLVPDMGLERGPEPPEIAFLAFKSLRTGLDAGFASALPAALGLVLSGIRKVVSDVQKLGNGPCLTRD